MKRTHMLIAFLLSLLTFAPLCSAMEVVEGVITTAVRERSPVDAVRSAPATQGKLYCFTRVAGAQEDSVVVHVWYRESREMARVELPVRSSDWRTWSSKTLLPEWSGGWRVEVLDAEGNLLSTIPFRLN